MFLLFLIDPAPKKVYTKKHTLAIEEKEQHGTPDPHAEVGDFEEVKEKVKTPRASKEKK